MDVCFVVNAIGNLKIEVPMRCWEVFEVDRMSVNTILRQNSMIFDYSNKKQPKQMRNGFIEEALTLGDAKGLPKHRISVKINRIPLRGTAMVEVLKIHSPSLLWVRPTNHIASQLIVKEPAHLIPLQDDEFFEWNYCLAPLRARVFGRVRILKIDGIKALVVFIDEGILQYVERPCLVSLKSPATVNNFPYHPWQAIAVSLVDAAPILQIMGGNGVWDKQSVHELKEIIDSFKHFKVETVIESVEVNTYGRTVCVRMWGLKERKKDGQLVAPTSISRLLLSRFPVAPFSFDCDEDVPSSAVAVKVVDAKEFNPFELDDNTVDPFVSPDSKDFPNDWKKEKETTGEYLWQRQLSETIIPTMSLEWLKMNGYYLFYPTADRWKLFVQMEPGSAYSPYEFYGRPIRLYNPKPDAILDDINAVIEADEQKGRRDVIAAMIESNETVQIRARELDAFYSERNNRRLLTQHDVKTAFEEGRPVHAIMRVTDERATYTGQFQRVQVIAMEDSPTQGEFFPIIQFLDSGGQEIVSLKALFYIHPSHCEWPAQCIQFSIHGLKPPGSESWKRVVINEIDQLSLMRFREVLRSDLPIDVQPIGISRARRTLWKPEEPGFMRPDTIFLNHLQVFGDESSIHDEMLKSARVTTVNETVVVRTSAARDDKAPLPLDAIHRTDKHTGLPAPASLP